MNWFSFAEGRTVVNLNCCVSVDFHADGSAVIFENAVEGGQWPVNTADAKRLQAILELNHPGPPNSVHSAL